MTRPAPTSRHETPPVVVGVDPLRHDPEAPVLAALLARATGAPVLAVAVYDTVHRLGRADEYEPRGAAMARLSAIEPAFYGLPFETVAISGPSAARVLQGCAAERGAGLLVVGATHHGVRGKITLGSTADRLLHGATCPVAVAPFGFAERMRGINRVGVAFIDSDEGYEALRAGVALTSAAGAELYAATAVEPIPWSATGFAHSDELEAHLKHLRGQAESTLRRALDDIQPAVRSRVGVLVGTPVAALEQFSSGVDLLVCGSRGYGPLESLLLGGISRRLIHRAACPVIVVPRGAEQALDYLARVRAAMEAGHV